MEIVYHLGVHCTDEDRIARCLLKNRETLAAEGIVVPWPRQYRYVFRDLLQRLGGKPASREVQELLLDGVMAMDAPRRVIFGNENFICLKPHALGHGMLYPMAGARARGLRNIFPDNPVSFRIGLRNPATFVPALYAASGATDYEKFLSGADPAQLTWSEMITRLRNAVPDAPITVWCNEDTPVLWPEVLRAVAGHGPETRLAHTDDFLAALMTPLGMERMQTYLETYPPATEGKRRRAVAAFLEKFAIPEQIEMELDLPGWTQDFVQEMTRAYEADVAGIARMPGVTLLA